MSKSLRRAGCAALLCALAPPALAEVAPTAVETIIVTARRNPDEPAIVGAARERLARTPGAVAVIAAETYETRLATGFPDILKDVPGILTSKRYGEEARLSIRGSGLDQSFHQRGVLLAQDGAPFADADGFSDFQKVDALGARYVEVYKGGNALRFGGAQLGGAINLVTPTGRTAVSDNMLRIEGGSFETLRGAAAIARVFGGWDVYAQANAMSSEGYRDHSAQEQARLTVNVGYVFGEDREVRLILYGADIAQEVPGATTLDQALRRPKRASAMALAGDWSRDQTVGRATLQTTWRFDESLSFEGGAYVTATDLRHPIPIVLEQDLRNYGAFGRFDWAGEIADLKADLFFGASWRQGQNDQQTYVNLAGRNGARIGDALQKASGLDLFVEGRLFVTDSLALVAGGTWGRATRDYANRLNAANDAARDYDWFAPRIGLIWESGSGAQIYANLTRSVEPPHYGALVQAPHPGFVPLDPQKAWTGEIGARGEDGAFIWDVAFYRAALEGELLSFTPEANYPAAIFNARRTIHQGVEASVDWRIIDGAPGEEALTLRQTYTWSDFRFDDDVIHGDNRLAVAPEHQYRVALKYEHASGFYIEPSLDWRPHGAFADYANTLKTPGYALVNLGLGWRFASGVTLFLDARNLADKRHVAEMGAVADARRATPATFYPGEGRAAFAGLALRF